ncbi:MAG TPA: hypothetical protein VHY37_11560 [Tepidisphaeraceae bacterium]|jgi:hypothetical protein|nr:hypothetical protein [Tepidisphaeraceae bacterium]
MNRELKRRCSPPLVCRLWVIPYSLFLIPYSLSAAPLRSPAASPDAIHAMFDAGKYRQVLRQTAIVLHLRDADKFGYDLHDTWILKAESHLRLKEQILSADAFESASKVAPDAGTADLDHATGIAVGECKAGIFYPPDQRENVKAKGFSMIDPAGRAKALAALFAERLAEAKRTLDPMEKEKSLKKVMVAAGILDELGRLERAATATDITAGKSDQTDAIAVTLATHVDHLIGDPLVKDSDQIEQIARNAGQTVSVQVAVPDPAHPGKTVSQQQEHKQGLSQADLMLLTQVQNDCKLTLVECADAAKILHVDPGIFAATTSAASFLLSNAVSIQSAP